MTIPTAFISYSWDSPEHRAWVRELATKLRGDGIATILDQWELAPGDQLPAFMERAVRENSFVLIICTSKYKEKSDLRKGGAGYEGDVMTAEIFTGVSRRKFIPLLRSGDWAEAAPSWLLGSVYISLKEGPGYERGYEDLVDTLHNRRAGPPPVQGPPGNRPDPT